MSSSARQSHQRRHQHHQRHHAKKDHHSNTQIVPFRISKHHARTLFAEWVNSQPLAPETLRRQVNKLTIRSVFLPFYTFRVSVKTKFTAELHQQEGDFGRSVQGIDHFVYHRNAPEMQVYGSYTFKRELVQHMKGPLTGVENLHSIPDVRLEDKEVDVFAMHSTVARDRVLANVVAAEKARMEERVEEDYRHTCHNMHVHCDMDYTYNTVLLPAHVIEFRRFGLMFRVVVNAMDGRVDGLHHYSPIKIMGLVLSPLLLLSGGPLLRFAYSALIPVSAAIGFTASLFPIVRQLLRERNRLGEARNEHDARDNQCFAVNATEHARAHRRYTDSMREERTRQEHRQQRWKFWERQQQRQHHHHYHHHQQQHQQQQQQQRQQQQREQDRREQARWQRQQAQPDTTYYELLGVSRTASLEQIQSAFRKLAFKWHPDRHQNPASKKVANEKFRDILKAYQTLRDPKKRVRYDMYGPSD